MIIMRDLTKRNESLLEDLKDERKCNEILSTNCKLWHDMYMTDMTKNFEETIARFKQEQSQSPSELDQPQEP